MEIDKENPENHRANSRLFASYLTGSSGAMKCNQGERARGCNEKNASVD